MTNEEFNNLSLSELPSDDGFISGESWYGESSDDGIWSPKTEDLDKRLVLAMGSFLASCSEDQVHFAYEELFSPTRGINGNRSLIDDVMRKSGLMATSYIREATNCLYQCIIRGIVATEVPRLLLSPLAQPDDDEVDEESYYHAQWIRGFLWESFASVVVLILSNGAPDAPVSSLDAMRRTRYLEETLYERNEN